MTGPQRAYPVELPEGGEDPRFTPQLRLDIAAVLEQHGYPPVTAVDDMIELKQWLFHFLYVGDRR